MASQIFDEVLSRIIRDYVDQPDLERSESAACAGSLKGSTPQRLSDARAGQTV
jgi:hypothetical protein